MKSTFKNLELSSEVVPISVPGFCYAGRFQVVVEYAFGVCVPAAVAESQEEAEEAFLVQSPGCDKGEILLFDHGELRVVASVKWKMDTTEKRPARAVPEKPLSRFALRAADFCDEEKPVGSVGSRTKRLGEIGP